MSDVVAMKEEVGIEKPAFGEVARDHQDMMLVYARTLLRDESVAREVVQEALVAAWKGMERFEVTRDLGSWLRGIVRNKWKDVCRKQMRKPEFAEEDLEYLESQMEALTKRPTVFDDLADCREKLPEEMGEVVSLSYDEGLKSEVVGEKLGLSGATVRKRLERARGLLQEHKFLADSLIASAINENKQRMELAELLQVNELLDEGEFLVSNETEAQLRFLFAGERVALEPGERKTVSIAHLFGRGNDENLQSLRVEMKEANSWRRVVESRFTLLHFDGTHLVFFPKGEKLGFMMLRLN